MTLKILVIGDPHGVVPKIDTSIFDAIICTGDFVPDKRLRTLIFSSIKKGLDWRDSVSAKKLKSILTADYKEGMKVLDWLNAQHMPLYFVPGNWDMSEKTGKPFYSSKISRLRNLVDCDEKLVTTDTFCVIGYGKTFEPELREDRLITTAQIKAFSLKFKQLDALFLRAKKKRKPVIFLTHNPPFGTELDCINNKKSPAHGKHFGSQITRELIEKHKPMVCICGHMHENQGIIKLKGTKCLNAGCLHDTTPHKGNTQKNTYFLEIENE